MLHTFLYNADGHDREVDLDETCVAELDDRSLLWVDVTGRERSEIERLASLFALDQGSLRELLKPRERPYLDNYGEYFQFDVIALANGHRSDGDPALMKRTPVHLQFVVGPGWIITVHEPELPFLQAFRDQHKGETLIGSLTAPSLAASLLDWHLSAYFEAVTELNAFLDRLDDKMMINSARKTLLVGVVATRRRVSELRHLLAVQRPVFNGLSRPDFTRIVESHAASIYVALEHRFERTLAEVDHTRELANGSFDLYTARTAEATNDLVRWLTMITVMLGAVGAAAGIFGMNFDTPYTETGVWGFWSVLGCLALLNGAAIIAAKRRSWI